MMSCYDELAMMSCYDEQLWWASQGACYDEQLWSACYILFNFYSLDTFKLSSYDELRRELARLIRLEGYILLLTCILPGKFVSSAFHKLPQLALRGSDCLLLWWLRSKFNKFRHSYPWVQLGDALI
jgi:hypothetical protein